MLFTQENKNAAPVQERHGLLMKKISRKRKEEERCVLLS